MAWRKIPIPTPDSLLSEIKKHREQQRQHTSELEVIYYLPSFSGPLTWSLLLLDLVNIRLRAHDCENAAFFFPVISSDYWPHFPKLKYFYYCGETTKEPLDFQRTVNSAMGKKEERPVPKGHTLRLTKLLREPSRSSFFFLETWTTERLHTHKFNILNLSDDPKVPWKNIQL